MRTIVRTQSGIIFLQGTPRNRQTGGTTDADRKVYSILSPSRGAGGTTDAPRMDWRRGNHGRATPEQMLQVSMDFWTDVREIVQMDVLFGKILLAQMGCANANDFVDPKGSAHTGTGTNVQHKFNQPSRAGPDGHV